MSKLETPDLLYKYYAPERLDFFESIKVRFSQLSALNDPFEFVCDVNTHELRKSMVSISNSSTSFISILKILNGSFYRSFIEGGKFNKLPYFIIVVLIAIFYPLCLVVMILIWPFVRRSFRKLAIAFAEDFVDLIEKFKSDVLIIFCCSENWNSVPMWAHYANNHKGFCIGFDPSISFYNLHTKSKSKYITPRKVSYIKNIPNLSKRNLNKVNFIYSKMQDWSYEQEWRFVAFPEDSKYRSFLNDGQELALFDMNPLAIKEITIGLNSSREFAALILEKVRLINFDITIYQVQKSLGYGFSRKLLNSIDDFVEIDRPLGAMKGFREDMVPRSMIALEEMVNDAKNHKILKRIID